jgi:hypothetical protein
MKKVACLLFSCIVLMTGCRKDETSDTGTLKMTFQISNSDFSNIGIYIYSLENLNYEIMIGHPINGGVFVQELLPGNYQVKIWYNSFREGPTFQIINGKETSFTYNLDVN